MRKNLFLMLLLLSSSAFVLSDPAWPDSVLVHQPDGTNLWVFDRGDEFYNWIESTDGYVITRNTSGIFEYAMVVDTQVQPSGIKVHNKAEKGLVEINYAKRQKGTVQESMSDLNRITQLKAVSQRRMLGIPSSPVVGVRKVLTILMGFSDRPFTYTAANFDSLMNYVNYSGYGNIGSVKDFYYENSYGQLTIESTVIGPFLAANNSSFYSRPSGSSAGYSGNLVVEAINLADSYGIDFSLFDGNNDGNVDCIHVIFAGNRYSAEGNGIIWPYHSALATPIIKDGKNISEFILTPEKIGNTDSEIASIGTICHELGHVLGAPDFYPVGVGSLGNQYLGTGIWDVMGNGSHNCDGKSPSHHNPYTKTTIYQWATTNTINSSEENAIYNIPASSQNSTAIYKIPTSTEGEYYLLENRQKVSFDNCLLDSGLLIYHISSDIEDGILNNSVNASLPQKCYLADATSLDALPSDTFSYNHPDMNVFPYKNYYGPTNIFFTSQTNPRSWSWDSVPTGVDVCFIQHDGNNIKFVVNPEIEGAPYLCDTMYHYIRNVPEGATIQWQLTNPPHSYFFYQIQGSTTSDSVLIVYHIPYAKSDPNILTPPNPSMPFDSAMTLSATITSGSSSYVVQKRLYSNSVGVPAISASDTSSPWPVNTARTFTVTNCQEVPDSMITWTVKRYSSMFPFGGTIVHESHGRTLTYTPTSKNRYYDIIATNELKPCGTNSAYKRYQTSFGGGIFNSAEDPLLQLQQRITDNNATYTYELWHTIYGRMRTQTAHSASEQIDTTGLPQGVYILLLKENGTTIAQTKVLVK